MRVKAKRTLSDPKAWAAVTPGSGATVNTAVTDVPPESAVALPLTVNWLGSAGRHPSVHVPSPVWSPASPVALVPCTAKVSWSPTRVGNWAKGTVALWTAPPVPGTLTTGGVPMNCEPLPQLDPETVHVAAGRLLSQASPWQTVQLTVHPAPVATVVTDRGASGPCGSVVACRGNDGVDWVLMRAVTTNEYVVLGRSPGTVNWVCPFTGNWVVAGLGPPATAATVTR